MSDSIYSGIGFDNRIYKTVHTDDRWPVIDMQKYARSITMTNDTQEFITLSDSKLGCTVIDGDLIYAGKGVNKPFPSNIIFVNCKFTNCKNLPNGSLMINCEVSEITGLDEEYVEERVK